MRQRRWIGWAVYLISAIIVVDILAFVTWTMLRFERADLAASAESDLQERVRLALWRMDSFMAPIIAQESARPYFHYRAYYPAERAYTRMWEQVQQGDVLVPSPLLLASRMGGATGGLIRLHFQIEPGGVVTSPQVPSGNMLDLAESELGLASQVARAEILLEQLQAIVRQSPRLAEAASQTPSIDSGQRQPNLFALKSGQEFNQRLRNLRIEQEHADKPGADLALLQEQQSSGHAQVSSAPRKTISVGSFRPVWINTDNTNGDMNTELMFLRPVSLDKKSFVQGIWIDWPMLQQLLVSYVLDLLPDAQLAPILEQGSDETETAWMLASLPARLDPGAQPPLPPIGFSRTRQILVVTWIGVLASIVAIGVVLRTSFSLSDRRGRFVSAVTHELRTPLTTFCLYTEMLADGVVNDETARKTYLDTLKSESKRLAGIVENVLAYARLSRPKSAVKPRTTVGDLLETLEPIMRRRVLESGGSIQLHNEDDVSQASVQATNESVERIITNLIENACKYGRSDDQSLLVEVSVSERNGWIQFRVRDHGRGIPPGEVQRVFAAFHRGSEQGSHAQPGLGLGLALARGLARELGGDLTLDLETTPGACFVLRLRAL